MGLPQPASGPASAPDDQPSRDLLVARQPILDADLNVRYYEVLYRAGLEGVARIEDAAQATSRVIADGFGDLGLERLVGTRAAFINVSRDFLLAVRPLPFSPGLVVLELLEDQEVDEQLLEVLREVTGHGFALALDDFVYSPKLEPLIELATIVKVDVLQQGQRGALEQLALLRDRGVRTVAEKVETREEFELYRDAGFDLFQGYFYARPNIVRGLRVPAGHPEALASIADIGATAGEFDALEEVIRRDVGLSYKLLRYANSAFFGLPREMESVREALTTLGARTVKQWATVLVMAGVAGQARDELIATGLLRARMCEQIGLRSDPTLADRCFTVGLFSVVDALLDVSMETALDELPLVEEVRVALLRRHGASGRALAAVLAWERGDFDSLPPGVGQADLAALYREAVVWADAATGRLG